MCYFTDGSRLDELSGCEFITYKDGSEWFGGSISLGEWATVFQALVHAISSLIYGLNTRGLHGSIFDNFSDTQVVP